MTGPAATPAQTAIGESGVDAEPTLIGRSPFIPAGWSPPQGPLAAPPPAKSTAAYTFRGVYEIAGEFRFLVADSRSNQGTWVELGETTDQYEVRNFDRQSQTLTLFLNGQPTELQLASMQANPTPMPVSGQITAPVAVRTPQPGTSVRPPVRRTIRPAVVPGSQPANPSSAIQTPGAQAPEWLQKLRDEAAARRASVTGEPPGETPPDAPDAAGEDVPPP